MSRFLAPLLPLFLALLLACGPAQINLGPTPPVGTADPCAPADNDSDGSFVYPPGCDEFPPLDCDDENPLFRAEEGCYRGNADLIPESCFDRVTWMLIIVDTNGDSSDPTTNNDYLAGVSLTFSDLTQYTTNMGAAMIDYVGQEVSFMTNGLSNQALYVNGEVFLYHDMDMLSELVPRINDPWVTWDCPSSG